MKITRKGREIGTIDDTTLQLKSGDEELQRIYKELKTNGMRVFWHKQEGWSFSDGWKTLPMTVDNYNELVGTLQEFGFGVNTTRRSEDA